MPRSSPARRATAAPLEVGPFLEFLRLLWRVNHAMGRRSRRMRRVIGVSAPQRMVLRLVGRFPGIGASELAHLLHLDRGTLSATLASLEAAQLLRRSRDPADGRRVLITLTVTGTRIDRRSAGTVEIAVEAALEHLTPATIRESRMLLMRLADELERESDPLPRRKPLRR